jgi:NDP-sugar pyrophosphorylase family protein
MLVDRSFQHHAARFRRSAFEDSLPGQRPQQSGDQVKLGAIVIVGTKAEGLVPGLAGSHAAVGTNHAALVAEPLSYVEVGGRSVLDRTIDRFRDADVEAISVLVEAHSSSEIPRLANAFPKVMVQVVSDLGLAITQKLSEYSENGIEHSFLNWADAYVETDLLDLFYFHREARQVVTRAFDNEGVLDLWVIDCANSMPIEILLREAESGGVSYFVREYVNRLVHPRDIRQLASDILRGRCERGPSGQQLRPGVWVDAGADIHRHARIVAPAYIGCGARISEDTLVTRCSTIEKECFVDCGTVIEDSSILANTHVGIWLDVCHAMVRGNRILSLQRDVMVEISDPRLMRSTAAVRAARARVHYGNKEKVNVPDFLEQPLAPKTWQFGANLIQE